MIDSTHLATWQEDALAVLTERPVCGYRNSAAPHVEPTALCSLALHAYQCSDQANAAADWLAEQQHSDGRIAAEQTKQAPAWGTGWAILAWKTIGDRWASHIERAVQYLVHFEGKPVYDANHYVEHDTTIPGWPWIQGTHSWLEPTAINVLGLEAAGYGDHPRAVSGRRLLANRILPNGGCNYGNTVVLSQTLRPHVEPTGLAMLALANRVSDDPRIDASLDYLESYLKGPVTTLSASYAILGLAAHGRHYDLSRIGVAAKETLKRHAGSGHVALALLAAQGKESPLIKVCMGIEA